MRFDVNGIPIHCPEGVDSTIAPPQNQRFSSKSVSWPLHTRKDATDTILRISIIYIVLFAKERTIERWRRAGKKGEPYFAGEIRSGAGSKTKASDDFVKEKLRGLRMYRRTTSSIYWLLYTPVFFRFYSLDIFRRCVVFGQLLCSQTLSIIESSFFAEKNPVFQQKKVDL